MPFNRDENFQTLEETLNKLKSLGFKIQKVSKTRYHLNEELVNTMFSMKNKKIQPKEDIHIIKAANSYLEMKRLQKR